MNLPKRGDDIHYPNVSINILFNVNGIIWAGNYIYTKNKFRTNEGDYFYNDEVEEWWTLPEIGTGVKLS